MIWRREEYLSHMTFQGSEREMFTELFGPLIGLEEEWRAQGATQDERSLKAFGWDSVKYAWLPLDIGARSGITPRVLEVRGDLTIAIDELGRTTHLSNKCATLPLPVTYPVETAEDWYRIRDWFAFDEARIDYEKLKGMKKLKDEGHLMLIHMPGGFDMPRSLLGEENLCYAYYDEPEMIHDMMAVCTDMMKKGLERIMDYVGPDSLCVHEDMAGISGPLVGPNIVEEFIAPYYGSVWNLAKQGGAQLFSQDSDGNMESVIEAFLATGLNVMYPAEPKAGMDVVKLRRQYGKRVAFKGGLDKFALRGTKEDIDRELEYKMSPEMLGGGMIFAIDHRIPNGVPIENYRYYVIEGRKRLGLPPAQPADFVRMAF